MSSALDSVTKWLTLPEVAEILGLSVGKVRRLIEEHTLFAVKRDGEPRVPAEIIVDGEPLGSLRGTIYVLLDSGFTVDEAVEWLYTPEASLGNTPMAVLLGGAKAPVRRLAQSLAT